MQTYSTLIQPDTNDEYVPRDDESEAARLLAAQGHGEVILTPDMVSDYNLEQWTVAPDEFRS